MVTQSLDLLPIHADHEDLVYEKPGRSVILFIARVTANQGPTRNSRNADVKRLYPFRILREDYALTTIDEPNPSHGVVTNNVPSINYRHLVSVFVATKTLMRGNLRKLPKKVHVSIVKLNTLKAVRACRIPSYSNVSIRRSKQIEHSFRYRHY